jgi:SAM-dependent methyltransferase
LISIETTNRRAWASQDAVDRYCSEGWTDPGERAAVGRLAGEMAGKRILDIGVGEGRTIPMLTAISEDYLGVDYTARLLEGCRARHPGRRLEQMDARDMAVLDDASFDWVVFSYNGIDATGFEDRARVFAEVNRVLRPGGVFLFSTHNRGSDACGEKPWSWFQFTVNPLRLMSRGAKLAIGLTRDLPNYLRNRRHNEHHEGWSTLVITYIDLDLQQSLLAAAGFNPEATYGSETEAELTPGSNVRHIAWFHVVARKRR